ncbi:MAG: hypothetical protein AAFY17_04020 [Cyanobacteria bacterium J06642_11]
MKNYNDTIAAIATNDAVIESVAVALTVYGWVKAIYTAGKSARAWWESDSMGNGSHIARLVVGIIYIAVALTLRGVWQYFTTGKAQAHWKFINTVVDDGVGLYGPSPMGDAVVRWGLDKIQELRTAMASAKVRLGTVVTRRYGQVQARVFAVS